MTTREIPRDVTKIVNTARALEATGRSQMEQSANMIRDIAKQLDREGWRQADIADALGVSQQRVSQLVRPPKKKKATTETGPTRGRTSPGRRGGVTPPP